MGSKIAFGTLIFCHTNSVFDNSSNFKILRVGVVSTIKVTNLFLIYNVHENRLGLVQFIDISSILLSENLFFQWIRLVIGLVIESQDSEFYIYFKL